MILLSTITRKNAKVARKQRIPKGLGQGRISTFGGMTMTPKSNLYRFAKVIDAGIVTSTSAADGLYADNFSLANLSENASFTSIFDQYRLVQVELELVAVTQPQVTAATSMAYAFCAVVVDYDDASALASFSLALNYSNFSILPPGRGLRKVIKPHVNLETNTSSQVANQVSPWLDCSDINVPHFGFKFAVKQSTSTFVSGWYRFYKLVFEFKNVR